MQGMPKKVVKGGTKKPTRTKTGAMQVPQAGQTGGLQPLNTPQPQPTGMPGMRRGGKVKMKKGGKC